MMTSAIIEKVLYLAITPDIFKAFEDSIFLSFRGWGGGGGGGGGGGEERVKRQKNYQACPSAYTITTQTHMQ